ncbi:hypothetical protein ACIBL6_22735 [Streptomyces sp. NPDC050400]|uniref:hypothetical protein n=1 Tax=Streptomyces sp. NPDC050400 TaxID=3365610 RepID=UPI0037A26037
MSVAGNGAGPECFPLAEDLKRLMGSEAHASDVRAVVERAARMLREVYPQVLATALDGTAVGTGGLDALRHDADRPAAHLPDSGGPVSAPVPATGPTERPAVPFGDLPPESLPGHLDQAARLFGKMRADLAGKFLAEAHTLLWQRNVELPPLPGGSGRADPAVLETVRDAVAWTLYSATKDKADRLATAARSALDIAAPGPTGIGGAPRAGAASTSTPVTGATPEPPAPEGNGRGAMRTILRRGTDGRGVAGWLRNEGAPQRETELSAKYGIRIGPTPGDGAPQHFSHSTLARIDQVLAKLPPEHVRDNPHLLAIEFPGPEHSGAASEYDDTTRSVHIALPLHLPSWIVTELNRKSGWQRWVMDQAARADYQGDGLLDDLSLGRLTDARHVMGGVSDALAQNNFMKWSLTHEIGHSVDEQVNWQAERSDEPRFGGWRHHGRNTVPVALAVLGKAGIGDTHYGTQSTDGRRTLLEVVVDALDPEAARSDPDRLTHLRDEFPGLPEQLKRGLDEIGRFARMAVAQPWTFNDGGGDVLRVGSRAYHVDHYGDWVSYLHAERENHALSNYQFSSPKEWFAETYAAYYGASDAARARLNPAVRTFFADELPTLVRPLTDPGAGPSGHHHGDVPPVSGPAAGSPARHAAPPQTAGEPSTPPATPPSTPTTPSRPAGQPTGHAGPATAGAAADPHLAGWARTHNWTLDHARRLHDDAARLIAPIDGHRPAAGQAAGGEHQMRATRVTTVVAAARADVDAGGSRGKRPEHAPADAADLADRDGRDTLIVSRLEDVSRAFTEAGVGRRFDDAVRAAQDVMPDLRRDDLLFLHEHHTPAQRQEAGGLTVPGLTETLRAGLDLSRPAGPHRDAATAAGRLGPDVFGVRETPQPPEFLRDVDFSQLDSAHREPFFAAVDLARNGTPTASELARLPRNADSVVHSLATWVPADSRPGFKRLAIPKLLHSIWLGGPLRDEGAMGEFRAHMAEGKNLNPDVTFVLWTDVTRAEADAARNLPAGPGQGRLFDVRDMLEWARRDDIRLVNVDEVFSAASPMRLPALYATEAARHTGGGYAAASDILRVEALYRFGGVYSDGDNQVHEGLVTAIGSTLKKAGGFAIGRYMGRSTNAALIGAARHPALAGYSDVILTNYTRSPYQNVHASALYMGGGDHIDVTDDVRSLGTVLGAGDSDIRRRVLNRTGPSPAVFAPLRHAQHMTRDVHPDVPWDVFAINSGKSWLEGEKEKGKGPSGGTSGAASRPALTPGESADVARSVAASLLYDLHDQPGNLNLAHYDSVVARTSDPDTVWTAILKVLAEIPGVRDKVTSVTLSRQDGPSGPVRALELPTAARQLLDLGGRLDHEVGKGVSPARLLDPATVGHPWAGHALLDGVARATATLDGLDEARRHDLFREAGRIMANRHREPPIIRADVAPGSPEAHYLALHDDMATLIAERLHTDPGDGLPDHQRPARLLSEQLRETFQTHATGGAAGGGIRDLFTRKKTASDAPAATTATQPEAHATPLLSRDVRDWPAQVEVTWRAGQNGGVYVVDAGPAGRAVVKFHEDAAPSRYADGFIRTVTGVHVPESQVYSRDSDAARRLVTTIAQHVPDWGEHADGLADRYRHVTVSEFAEGVPIDMLGVQQRRELLDNPDALRQLGSLMLVTDALVGTTDRLGIGLTGHFVNWGNVLYDDRSRRIVTIDNDTTLLRPGFDAVAHAEAVEHRWADGFERLADFLYSHRPGLSTGMPDSEFRDSVGYAIEQGALDARGRIGGLFAEHGPGLQRDQTALFPQRSAPDAVAIGALADWARYRWGAGSAEMSGPAALGNLRAAVTAGSAGPSDTPGSAGPSGTAGSSVPSGTAGTSPLVMRVDVQSQDTGNALRQALHGRLDQLEPGSAEFERVQRVIDSWEPGRDTGATRVSPPQTAAPPHGARGQEPWRPPVPAPGTRLSLDVVRHPQWFAMEKLTGLDPEDMARIADLDLTDGSRLSTDVRDAVRQAAVSIREHIRDTPGVGLANADLLITTPPGGHVVWGQVAQALADDLSHRIKLVLGGETGPVIEVCP